jgi:hypothetical protein
VNSCKLGVIYAIFYGIRIRVKRISRWKGLPYTHPWKEKKLNLWYENNKVRVKYEERTCP